ncbi:HAD-IIIC family phosphatase [Spirillospora sp. NPDC052269]
MPKIKCTVWDLDDTLWDGVLLEGDRASPRPAVVETIRELDRRGVLHAVASRNVPELARSHLAEHGLADYFCALEIGWGAKSESVRRIAAALNIGLDTIAFVDNDDLELAEVAAACPEVRAYPADLAAGLASLPEFQPDHQTAESRDRRSRYQAEQGRTAARQEFPGTSAEFLASLDLVMTVLPATDDDLVRAHELTVRTNQLNTTGLTFDEDTLRKLTRSPGHEVLVARLADRFGHYGTVGLAVTRLTATDAELQLLLMSCRVMSRGVGTVLLHHVMDRALRRNRRPLAWFAPTPVNRVMLVTLRFAGFEPLEERGDRMLLGYAPGRPLPPPPPHVSLITGGTS